MTKVTYQCAWCSKVIGSSVFPSDEADNVISHTICRQCKETLLEEAAHLVSEKPPYNNTNVKGERHETKNHFGKPDR